VARQHLGQEEGKRAPATAALAAIGTKDPLTPRRPGAHPRGVVTVEFTVAIQRLDAAAVRATLLLEGKKLSESCLGPPTN